jgi:hypothetical protein
MFQPSTMVNRRLSTLPSRIATRRSRADMPGSSAYSPTCSLLAAPSSRASACHSTRCPVSTPALRNFATTDASESPRSTTSVSPCSMPGIGASEKPV